MSAQDFIRLHRDDDVFKLALSLRGHKEASFILRQIEGWQRLRHKILCWSEIEDLHYPPRVSLEQCSSEATALYKYAIVRRILPHAGRLTDLTGGFGVDFCFLAPHFTRAIYVEKDDLLTQLALHNFPLLGVGHATIVKAEASEYLLTAEHSDLMFIDPSRRDAHGRRVVRVNECSPDVRALWPIIRNKAKFVMLKLSPMLDISDTLHTLPGIEEVHIVGHGGECKELLLVGKGGELGPISADKTNTNEPRYYCHDDDADFSFLRSEELGTPAGFASQIESYLYDPSPVVLKAGALHTVAARFKVAKLSQNTHLYTSSQRAEGFPGRVFRVVSVTGCSKRDISPFVGKRANLAVRNFPEKVETLRARWKIRDGAHDYLFAVGGPSGGKLLIHAVKAE